MSKPISFQFVVVSLAALLLPACGSDKAPIPPVAPVVQPMPEEGLLGEEAASDANASEPASDTSEKPKTEEPAIDTSKSSSGNGDADLTGVDSKSEGSNGKSDSAKSKSGRTKYKHKTTP
jgi:hypothetical protein